jgi:hypothetical protein
MKDNINNEPCEMLQWVLAHPLLIKPGKVARATGLPYAWLWALIDGKIKQPSVNRISLLHNWLKTQDLAAQKENEIEG